MYFLSHDILRLIPDRNTFRRLYPNIEERNRIISALRTYGIITLLHAWQGG